MIFRKKIFEQITIGSWLNGKSSINFASVNVNYALNNYVQNSNWFMRSLEVINSIGSSRFTLINSVSSYDFALKSNDLVYNMTLVRKPLYMMINCIFPNLVLNCIIFMYLFLIFKCLLIQSQKGIILIAFLMPYPIQIALCESILTNFKLKNKKSN